MRPVTLETTGDPLPGTPDPRCWVRESWPHRHMLPHVIAWVLMVMDILSGRKGMLHTGRENGDCGVTRCLGPFIARVMWDGLK